MTKDEEPKSIEQLKDDFDTQCERVYDRIYDFHAELDTFLEKLHDILDGFSEIPNDALNKVISFGFVPGAKVRVSQKDGVKELNFVGYDFFGHMTFHASDGKRIGSPITFVAKNLDRFELINEEKQRND